MQAKNLISGAIPYLLPTDTGQKALNCMETFRISHLPVVRENIYLGLISDRFIEDLNLTESILEDYTSQIPPFHVHPDQHIYEVASLMYKHGLSLTAVADDDFTYRGAITLHDLSVQLIGLLSIPEPGGVIILQTAGNNFSVSQIGQIVESNDARILSLMVNKTDKSGNLEIILKIDRVDLSAVIQTFIRYGYQITDVVMDDSMLHGMYEDRVALLLKYLNL